MSDAQSRDVNGALQDLADTTKHAAGEVADSVGSVLSALVHTGNDALTDQAGAAVKTVREQTAQVHGQVADAVGVVAAQTRVRRRRWTKQAAKASKRAAKQGRATRGRVRTGALSAMTDARVNAVTAARGARETAAGAVDAARSGAAARAADAKSSLNVRRGLSAKQARRSELKSDPTSSGKAAREDSHGPAQRAALLRQLARARRADGRDPADLFGRGRHTPARRGRSGVVVKVLLVLTAVAAGVAVLRALRPAKATGTGSSLPPRVRPVPPVPPVAQTDADAVRATVSDSAVAEPLVTPAQETAPAATAPVGPDTTVAPQAEEFTDIPAGPSDAALGGTPTES